MTILYDVIFCANLNGRYLHLRQGERRLATVKALEAPGAFMACHYTDSKRIAPDYAAIRSALPHYHVKAFDRAGAWYFPNVAPAAEITPFIDRRNAASLTLYAVNGRLLGTLYAIPYRFTQYTKDKES